jgi:hypothetical protein
MAEATRLTRRGRLAEATALIQQTLGRPAGTWQAADPPSAEEETSGTAGHLDPLPALRAEEAGRADTSWLARRGTFPGRRAQGLSRPRQPAPRAMRWSAGQFDAYSYTSRRHPGLPALRPGRSHRRPAAASRDAARRDPGRREFRRRHRHERPRRTARIPRCLPRGARHGEPRQVLELVCPRSPAPGRR